MIDWLAHHAPMAGLMFFFVFFVCVAVWLYWPSFRTNVEPFGLIPLNEDRDDRS